MGPGVVAHLVRLGVLSSTSDHASVVSINLFIALLCACIVLGHLLEENRWVNESITALIIGLCTGVVILLTTKGKSSRILVFSEDLFFIYLLPPIIFNAGFQVKKKQFFRNFMTITLFGAVGTMISFFTISFGAIAIFSRMDLGTLDIGDFLAIGAIFSATDSVCTLQVLNQDETPLLYSLVFGEGVVNDATSVVLFNALQNFDLDKMDVVVFLKFLGNFCYLFLSSTFLGVFSGLLSAYIIKKLYIGRHSTDREVALMMLMAYLSYMLAELSDLSGILTVFFCGIVMSHYTWHNVTESSRVTTKHAFATLSFIAETFLFLYVGMDALDIEKWKFASDSPGKSIGISSILLGLVLVGRAAFVFPLSLLSNLTKKASFEKITWRQQIVIWWAGLMRGAVSIALAYNKFTRSGHTELHGNAIMITSTITVVLFSTMNSVWNSLVREFSVADLVRSTRKTMPFSSMIQEMKGEIGAISRRGLRSRSHRPGRVRRVAAVEPDEAARRQSCWAQLPLELLREVLVRVEEAGARWPGRRDVVASAGVCRSWRAIVKEIVGTPEASGKLTFPISLKQPGPRDATIKCFIRRDRTTQTYYLCIGLTDALADDGKFLLAARKYRRPSCSEFLISLDVCEMSKGHGTYVGKLRSNFLGTKFIVYDVHPPCDGAVISKDRSAHISGSTQISPRVPAGNYPVSHISYELNVMGSRGPRKMNCIMDSISASAVEEGGTAPTQTAFPSKISHSFPSVPFFRYKSGRLNTSASHLATQNENKMVLKNKSPRWHEQLQCWCLNFHGRVTVASIKNFQLVASDENGTTDQAEHDEVILQFGKIGKDLFTMDYRYPISAFQAFAICLSSFDTKIACE